MLLFLKLLLLFLEQKLLLLVWMHVLIHLLIFSCRWLLWRRFGLDDSLEQEGFGVGEIMADYHRLGRPGQDG